MTKDSALDMIAMAIIVMVLVITSPVWLGLLVVSAPFRLVDWAVRRVT